MKTKHFTSAYVSVAVILLSCLGAISVGFATWVISQGDTANPSGTIKADSVDVGINGISITASSVFQYGHYFFKGNSNTYKNNNEGQLVYTIQYDPNTIEEESLDLLCSLSFSDANGNSMAIFNNTYLTEVEYNTTPIAQLDFNSSNNTGVGFGFTQAISGTSTISSELVFTFSNKLIAKYGEDMAGGTFYLRLETN